MIRHWLELADYICARRAIHTIVQRDINLLDDLNMRVTTRTQNAFGALRSIITNWWDVSIYAYGHFSSRGTWPTREINMYVMHVLGTRLLQKCLRHSPPGVVCTQVWNLKELTEGHHKNAWSMWLNLTQRGKSYRVRTHWGLTVIKNK